MSASGLLSAAFGAAAPQPLSNGEYLEAELALLERRAKAVAQARETGEVEVLGATDEAIERERLALVARRREAAQIPLEALSRQLELDAIEEQALLTAVAPHLSHRLWQALVFAQGSVLKPWLELGFVSDLLRPRAALISDARFADQSARLVREGLLWTEPAKDQGATCPRMASALHAPHFLGAWLRGEQALDASLAEVAELWHPRAALFDVILPPRTQALVDQLVSGFYRRGAGLVRHDRSDDPWCLLVHGAPRAGKTALVEGLATLLEQPVLSVHLDRLPEGPGAAHALRVAGANARLLGAVLHLVRPEALAERPSSLRALVPRLIRRHRGLVALEADEPQAIPARYEDAIDLVIPIERLSSQERQLIWDAHLPRGEALEIGELSTGELAASFDLTGGKIRTAIAWAERRARVASKAPVLRQRDLVAGARAQLRARLGDFTDASEVRLSLKHLVLPSEAKDAVEEFLGACRARHTVMNEWGFAQRLVTGKGLIALFSGEPGTGKTLCAEILAGELDLDLHIVSIPKVVSKWVGETEKNIQQVFSHARAQNSMLLFDEADSLFTKRVSVERSSDHYQNMEVNLLLQEIERFEGIVILTTNLAANLDKAFQRRIAFKIDFPMPEAEQREHIWRALIPGATPADDDVDFGALADRFELSGGQIKNAVVRAAYRCAAAGSPLSQQALEATAIEESKAAGKLVRA